MTKVLGIDPGTGIVGFGIIETHHSKPKLIDAGVVRTPVKQPLPDRLQTIYDELDSLIQQHRPTVMVVELLYFARNVTTAMSVSHARGVILLLGKRHRLEIVEVTPLQIKQALTGYGKADKQQVQEMVRVMLGLATRPQPDDCADALAAALCYQA